MVCDVSQKRLDILFYLQKTNVNDIKLDFSSDHRYGNKHSHVSHKQNELDLMHSDICSVPAKT